MNIIIALGNPGDKYKNTRHNISWLFLDYYLGDVEWQENKKFQALIYKDLNTIFVKPLTYMNLSGLSVKKILNYYNLIPKSFSLIRKKDFDLNDSLLVIQDDVDIDFGKHKISYNSSSGGHNGIKSIIENIKTQKFKRLRLGIKNEQTRTIIPTDKFVLQNFSSDEINQLTEFFKNIDFKSLL